VLDCPAVTATALARQSVAAALTVPTQVIDGSVVDLEMLQQRFLKKKVELPVHHLH
jgi:hypothetical protein